VICLKAVRKIKVNIMGVQVLVLALVFGFSVASTSNKPEGKCVPESGTLLYHP